MSCAGLIEIKPNRDNAIRAGHPWIFSGNPDDTIDAAYLANPLYGQKTGFYLDQRETRRLISSVADKKRVVNLFSYAGSGSVDSSKPALTMAEEIFRLNGLDPLDERYDFIDADVFDYLDNAGRTYAGRTLLSCDPPAFAKHRRSLENAKKVYRKLTNSCSGMIDRDAFTEILRHVAGTAGKQVSVIKKLGTPPDHTRNFAFAAGGYLKTLLLGVTG